MKVTLVLDEADADLLADCAAGHAGSCGGERRRRALALAKLIRAKRRHRHGRIKT